jgi:hypothetical protein
MAGLSRNQRRNANKAKAKAKLSRMVKAARAANVRATVSAVVKSNLGNMYQNDTTLDENKGLRFCKGERNYYPQSIMASLSCHAPRAIVSFGRTRLVRKTV